ncbi:MAG: fused MFS/spermidine synthase [Nitrospinaceae bacterium]|jgi:spermidine synthase|nr:fused MFS/spermidine synthase [Nitrospinaceae bacterium]
MNHSSITASRFVPFFCLFISGTASLVYELIWIRQLALVFGGTLYAISAVLCAFMTGLALGAWAIGRFINSRNESENPVDSVRLYGLLEGAIGLYALFFPYGLDLLTEWYAPIVAGSLDLGSQLHWIEFGLSAVLMLPATVCMGATLPLIGSWSIGDRSDRVIADISILYSLNTFGAVAGCLYAQMFAVKFLGINGTNLTAVAMNGLVFLLCVTFRKRSVEEPSTHTRNTKRKKDSGGEPAPERGLSILLLLIFIYSGMASLASEILWTRVLVFPMGTTLYSFALILATFLFGIALGSLVADKLLGDSHRILKFLLIELAIAITCIAILPMFERLHEWTLQADHLFYDLDNIALKTLGIRSLFAFGLMFLPTLGFGLLFPLANRIHLNLFGTVSGTLGNSYALNTMGAVLGTILTPFIFIPLMGIRLSLFAIYSVLIILCFAAMTIHFKWSGQRLIKSAILTTIITFAGYFWSTPQVDIQQPGDHNLARTEINIPKSQLKLLEYKEGDFSTLSVTEDRKSGARTLYMNGFSTATVSDSIGGSAYMQAMGFVPMALHPAPKKALVICFGTGNTTGTVSLFPGVEVDGVEIDKHVLSFAHRFSKWNRNVLEKSNVHMRIQDGRTFTRWTSNKYDVITLEPMSPVQAGTVNLYSKEFYQLAANRLNKDGLMMQWLPLHLVGPEDARSILKTFQEVFPHTSTWNSFLTRIVLLVGSNEPIVPDKIRFDELMQTPELKEAAQQMGVNSFLDFTDFFLTDGERVKPFVESAEVVTDDRPLLEFSPVTLLPPLQWQVDETFLNLLRHRVGHYPEVRGLITSEKNRWRKNFRTRTAQRLSVFSRRYHGPGEHAFNQRNYRGGIKAIKAYLNKQGDEPIRLKGTQWK